MRVLLRAASGAVLAGGLVLAAGIALHPHDAAADSSTVRLDAVIAKGGAPIKDSMNFAIWSLNGGGNEGVVARRDAAPAEVSLQPGDYRIVAEYGAARRVQDIRVDDTPSQRRLINLNAGEVGLRLVERVGGKTVRAPLDWEIRRYSRGAGKGEKVVTVRQERPHLVLREGWYEVEVRHGGKTRKHAIEVGAGQRYDYTLVLNQ
jgi:hypothetical protein